MIVCEGIRDKFDGKFLISKTTDSLRNVIQFCHEKITGIELRLVKQKLTNFETLNITGYGEFPVKN